MNTVHTGMVEFLRLEKVRSQNFHKIIKTQENVYIEGIKEIPALIYDI